MARPAIVSTLLIGLLSTGALAQEPAPRNTRPVPIQVPQIGGNGHTETWDGRVFIVTQGYNGVVGWIVRVLRPENVRLDNGVPAFVDAAWSDPVPLELDGAPNTGMTDHNAVAAIPLPGVTENPFRSD